MLFRRNQRSNHLNFVLMHETRRPSSMQASSSCRTGVVKKENCRSFLVDRKSGIRRINPTSKASGITTIPLTMSPKNNKRNDLHLQLSPTSPQLHCPTSPTRRVITLVMTPFLLRQQWSLPGEHRYILSPTSTRTRVAQTKTSNRAIHTRRQ